MTIYDFENPPSRRLGDSIKWRAYPEDVLPLWIADMDFVSPAPRSEASPGAHAGSGESYLAISHNQALRNWQVA